MFFLIKILNAPQTVTYSDQQKKQNFVQSSKSAIKTPEQHLKYTLILNISRMDWHQTDNWDVDRYEWKEQTELLYLWMSMLSGSQIQVFCHIQSLNWPEIKFWISASVLILCCHIVPVSDLFLSFTINNGTIILYLYQYTLQILYNLKRLDIVWPPLFIGGWDFSKIIQASGGNTIGLSSMEKGVSTASDY